MRVLERIREKVRRREMEFTIPHFFEEMANDGFVFDDIEAAIMNGTISRKFTRDPRGTRYEVTGRAPNGRSVAIICRFKDTGKLLFITAYAMEEDA